MTWEKLVCVFFDCTSPLSLVDVPRVFVCDEAWSSTTQSAAIVFKFGLTSPQKPFVIEGYAPRPMPGMQYYPADQKHTCEPDGVVSKYEGSLSGGLYTD
jgi:hypothetical protein